jgi:hypothetical protein
VLAFVFGISHQVHVVCAGFNFDKFGGNICVLCLCCFVWERRFASFVNFSFCFSSSVSSSINHLNQLLFALDLFLFPHSPLAGQANLAAVLTFVFSMLFGGLFLNNSTVSSSSSDGDQTVYLTIRSILNPLQPPLS